MSRHPVARTLLTLVLLGAPSFARAGDHTEVPESRREDRAASRRHFERAEVHFKKGRFAAALAEYEAGYRQAPLPGFLINIGHCHRMMGDRRKARAHYRKYLLVDPGSPRRGEVEETIRLLDRAIAETEGGRPARSTRPGSASAQRWIWSALASAFVGTATAWFALARSEATPRRPAPSP